MRPAPGLLVGREFRIDRDIEGGRSEQPVRGESLIPFGEIVVAGDNGGDLVVAFGEQVVEIFVGGRTQWLQAEVIDDGQG